MVQYKLPEEKIQVPRFEEAAGFYTTAQRSRTMSKIRNKNTRPEMRLRKALWNAGLRYRLHQKDIPGRPDVVIEKWKVAIFVDGEFWHGYEWSKKRDKIKTNRAFWIPKIERNMQRDREVNMELKRLGSEVFRFWEDEEKKEIGTCVQRVLDFVEHQKKYR